MSHFPTWWLIWLAVVCGVRRCARRLRAEGFSEA